MTASSKPGRQAYDFPGQVVLVLQGGGALGAYQLGVYEALHEAGIEPDWVIGTSIGSVNGAIIAGNPPETRLEQMMRFWARVEQKRLSIPWSTWFPGSRAMARFEAMTMGIPGFFSPSCQPLGFDAGGGVEETGFYSTAALRKTLEGLIHLNHLNSGWPRFTLGAVNVCTGRMRYFDSRESRLGIEHILASSALPPAFPAVRIDGEAYWDGGIYSNTPVEAVFDDAKRRSSVVFAVQLWNPAGPEPETIWQVMARHKDIQFSSRAESHLDRQMQMHHLRHVIRELGKKIAEDRHNDPEIETLVAYGCSTTMHLIQLTAPSLDGDDQFKDIDFTTEGVELRRQAGLADTRRMIERRPWEEQVDPAVGVSLHSNSAVAENERDPGAAK